MDHAGAAPAIRSSLTSPSHTLTQTFVAHVPEALRDDMARIPDLEDRLIGMVADAHDEWRELGIADDVFLPYIGARIPDDRSAADGLSVIRPADLYLACACAQGDDSALRIFERKHISSINLALARMRLPKASIDEVKQLVRQKLFVAEPTKQGKIVSYSGRGDLGRWVRAIAVRTCLNFMRKGKREVLVENEQMFAGVSADAEDPEIAYIKQRYRDDFRQAFEKAIGLLDDRQRTLLKYHHVDELNIDEIGSIYRVHRVTAYRWLEKAKEALVGHTLDLLRARLNVEQPEMDSILRMIRSQLHLSIHRVFGADAADADDAAE